MLQEAFKMRTFVRSTTLSLLLAAGLLVFGAATAGAYATSMSSNYSEGTILSTSETVTVTVRFDTEGAADVSLLSVSILFDDAIMSIQTATSPTYGLYTGGKGATYLKPASTNLSLRVGTTNQLLMDWQNNLLPGSESAVGAFDIAVVVFHVGALGDGAAGFTLSNSSPGNNLQLGDNSTPVNNVSGDFVALTPEPTTALLVGLGLLGLGVAGRRRD